MAIASTLLGLGAKLLGGASALAGHVQGNKDRAATKAAARKQEIAAREAGKLKGPTTQNTRVKVGSADNRKSTNKKKKGTGARQTSSDVGSSLSVSAARIGGL